MKDDRLSQLLRRGGEDTERRGLRCLDEEILAAYLDGGLSEIDRAAVQGHLADCSFCLDQVGLLLQAEGEPEPPAVPAELLARVRGQSRVRGLFSVLVDRRVVAAAAAGLALVAGLRLWQSREGDRVAPGGGRPVIEDTRRVRNGSAPAELPRLLAPREGDVVALQGIAIDWEEMPGADYYEVQIVAENGDVAYRSKVDSPPLNLPAGTALVTDRQYYLWVRAHLAGGATMTSSIVGFQTAPD